MKIYHQTGHRYQWNLQSFVEDRTAHGLILSPVNIDSEKIKEIDRKIKEKSFFDPQYYLLKDCKGKLSTYDFFPANMKKGIKTSDYENLSDLSAEICIKFQLSEGFEYIVIPTRYYDELPSNYFEKMSEFFVEPFIKYINSKKIKKRILLTVIIKQIQIMDEEKRNEILNWITGIQEISGVYIIFENTYTSKQIKDSTYLLNVLTIIKALKDNDLEVHIGYNNTEGFIYSIANPESVCIGSYENLRSFNIKRFIAAESSVMQGPRARLYSRKLLQWIDYGYIGGIQKLYKDWNLIFEDSKYRPLMFKPDFKWHFQKKEPYMHYFLMFHKQLLELPEVITERIKYVKEKIEYAMITFDKIKESGVVLDSDSDGSHLPFWLTSINMYEKYLQENENEI